jgi:signal transduction histidine kinase
MAGLTGSPVPGRHGTTAIRANGLEKKWMHPDGKARNWASQESDEKKLDRVATLLFAEIGRVREEERQKIAGDLHDQIGQNLILAKMKLDALKSSLGSEHASLIGGISDLISCTIGDTRSLIHELHLEWLSQLSFREAVNWLAEQTQKKYGLRSVTEFTSLPKALKKDVQEVVFQAVRELLVNAAKHAAASEVRVFCDCQKGWLRVHIVDNGVGFNPELHLSPNPKAGGFGLMIVRARLRLIGGSLHVNSCSGAGTRATIALPVNVN